MIAHSVESNSTSHRPRSGAQPLCLLLAVAVMSLAATQATAQTPVWQIDGQALSELLGRTIAVVGDLGGLGQDNQQPDGVPDFVIGANTDTALVVSGADGSVIHTLVTTSGNSLGADRVAAAGDVDGDGTPDIIVTDTVFSGDDGQVIWILSESGGSSGPAFGASQTGLGDLDSPPDGHAEFAISWPHVDVGGAGAVGRVFVYDGATGQIRYILEGSAENDIFGRDVDSGDVDNDGTLDLIVGASGYAQVFSGYDGSLLRTVPNPTVAAFGRVVAFVGDLDGDGCDDYAVRASGSVWVYSGFDAEILFTFYGSGFWGYSVSGGGDVNGDGTPDIAIGAHGGFGRAVVFSGFNGAQLMAFEGEQSNSEFGHGLALADVNADGLADVVIGAPFLDIGGTSDVGQVTMFVSPIPGPAPDPALSFVSASSSDISLFVGTGTTEITVEPRDANGVALGTGQNVVLSTTGGALLGSIVDKNDGSGTYTQTLQADRALPSGTVIATVNGILLDTMITITFSNPPIDAASSDLPVAGTVSGSFLDTQEKDSIRERINERESGGKPSNRFSYLEHQWSINVQGGSQVFFFLKAHGGANADGDDFQFSSSLDGSNWTPLLTVSKPFDDFSYQTVEMDSGTSGIVFVRVLDTDQTPGNRTLDSVFIDDMGIASIGGTGPTPPAAPTGLAATAVSSSEISLSWTDNSGNENGFEIERSADGFNWSLLTMASSNTSSHTDSGLSPSTTWFYRVRAINGAGESDYTNVASATTLPQPAGITVTEISPATMDTGTSIVVTITGSGILSGASVSLENGTGPTPDISNVVVVGSTSLTATISAGNGGPHGARTWDLRVTNPDSSTGVLPGGFTVVK